MYDKELALELICLIIDNIETVRKRTASINSSTDYILSNPEYTRVLQERIEKYEAKKQVISLKADELV